MTKIKVKGSIFDGTKKKAANAAAPKEKLKYSNWYVTISSNVRNGKDNKALEDFRKAVGAIFDDDNLLDYIEGDKEKIESIKRDVGVEVSDKMQYPHLHALIKTKHRTRLRLNYQMLRAAAAEAMGRKPENIHMRIVLVKPDVNLRIVDYLKKNVVADGEKPE